MKNITKILDALSLEGFKAAKEFAGAKQRQITVHETSDGMFFTAAFTGYYCWNTNVYNFYGDKSPYKITSFPYNLDNNPYVLHYVESVISGKNTYIKLAFNDDTEKFVSFAKMEKINESVDFSYRKMQTRLAGSGNNR